MHDDGHGSDDRRVVEEGEQQHALRDRKRTLQHCDGHVLDDRRNCEHCHVEDQYQLPLPSGLLASRWSDFDSARARVKNYYRGPTATACTGCHDGESTAVHAITMSIVTPGDPPTFGEACATCHAAGREYGIDRAHAWLGDE